ncbi:HAD family hydrolase [Microbispora sp. CA-135349]|uniref:HAD family hydrolase n=1 Tax=Microbispora sp. CA-135349 TaxID=3239953 RepID=UPI003D913BE1
MTRLALFDLDNTLIDRDGAFRRWVEEFADDHGLGAEAVERLVALDGHGYLPRETLFARAKEDFGIDGDVDDLRAAYGRRMSDLAHCPQEVRDGLIRLRTTGWRVAIVTNGQADHQLDKIRRTGLDEVVHAWAVSGAEGVRKPDRGLFEIAASRAGASLDAGGWMIGDHPVRDVAGGRAIGLATIWIDQGAWAGQEPASDHTVADVTEAIGILLSEEDGR